MKDIRFQVFVINMKRSPERLEFMSEQFKKIGMDFEVQEGIDGKTFDFSHIYDEQLAIKYNSRPLTPVERGCALSHRLILEKMLERNLDYVLIFEDDIEIPENFKKIIDNELKKRSLNKTSWEYISFNYPTVGLKYVRLWLFLFANMMKRDASLNFYLKLPLYGIKFLYVLLFSFFERMREEIYKRIFTYGKPAFFYRPLYLAGCYLVTKKGAEKLLSLNDKLVYPADRIQNVARIKKSLKHYGFVPLLARQRRDKFTSTLFDYSVSSKEYKYSDYD